MLFCRSTQRTYDPWPAPVICSVRVRHAARITLFAVSSTQNIIRRLLRSCSCSSELVQKRLRRQQLCCRQLSVSVLRAGAWFWCFPRELCKLSIHHTWCVLNNTPAPLQLKTLSSGSRAPLPPRFLHNHAVFSQFEEKTNVLSKFWAQAPPVGVKTPLGPPDQNPGSAPATSTQPYPSSHHAPGKCLHPASWKVRVYILLCWGLRIRKLQQLGCHSCSVRCFFSMFLLINSSFVPM